MLTQFIIAVFVLRSKAGYDIFAFISSLARSLLGFAQDGTAFLTDESVATLPWFLISVIPPIIFFVALVQLLYYFGTLQWAIGKFAVFFFWTLKVSGAEAVVAAASPFIVSLKLMALWGKRSDMLTGTRRICDADPSFCTTSHNG